MNTHKSACVVTAILLLTATTPVVTLAQGRPDTVALMASQSEAMAKLAVLDGTWRGPATTTLPNGDKHAITQTERVGSLLGGTIKVIEGRGYDAEGKTAFNAFAVVSYDAASKVYRFRSYAQGHTGDFVYQPTADGFTWDIPAGPAIMRYNAILKNGEWHETGDRIEAGKPPVRFFEMKLKRIGDSDWPAGGAVAPR